MKRVAQKIILSVSIWAVTAGTSLWASNLEEESTATKSSAFILSKKPAQFFTSDDIAFANQVAQEESDEELYAFDEPAPVPPKYPPIITAEEEAWRRNLEASRLAALSSTDEVIADEKEVKSPKTRRKSVKKTHSKGPKEEIKSESPKGGRKRTGSKVKKDETEILKELLPSSSGATIKSPLPTPLEITVLEESENHGPLMEATMPSKIVSAPSTLSHDEVEKLMGVNFINKKIELGFGSILSGDVTAEKKDIQGGKASHKLPELGAQRIKNLLELYPNACARLIIDEKREYHTLKDEGYKGVVGHYKLILPIGNGKYETIEGSSFTIAFAVLK
ncbi:MAG: hypothetical protein BGO76_06755 [Caedibacter sp. 38-128]|nr:hypothetical protein [Holosporales bacterium]OJX03834.1 MAG: hypothetical protein BGO76_06755 [Caedibacter sp. 38-128]